MHGEKQTWEYLRHDPTHAEDYDLDTLGSQGWELVSAADGLVFKRPAPNFRERVTLDQRRAVYERFNLPAPDDGR